MFVLSVWIFLEISGFFWKFLDLSVVLNDDGRPEHVLGVDDDEPRLHVARFILKRI
jgi:hypothetical protein